MRKMDSKWLEVDSKFIKVDSKVRKMDSKLGVVDSKYEVYWKCYLERVMRETYFYKLWEIS
jgi:hypothetical protein